MRIATYLSPTRALEVGAPAHGWTIHEIDPVALSSDQRAVLASVTRASAHLAHHVPVADLYVAERAVILTRTRVPVGTLDDSLSLIDAIDAALVAIAAYDARKKAEAEAAEALHVARAAELAAASAALSAWVLDRPAGQLYRLSVSDGRCAFRHCGRSLYVPESLYRAVGCRYPELSAAALERARDEAEALEIADQRAAEERAAEILTSRTAIVSALGNDDQRERHAAGVLPERELLDLVRDAAFAAISGWPRYAKLTDSDVRGRGSSSAHYDEEPADEMTSIEWEDLKTLRAALADCTEIVGLPVAISVEARRHIAINGDDEDLRKERLAAHATVTVEAADLTVTRLLALGNHR